MSLGEALVRVPVEPPDGLTIGLTAALVVSVVGMVWLLLGGFIFGG